MDNIDFCISEMKDAINRGDENAASYWCERLMMWLRPYRNSLF